MSFTATVTRSYNDGATSLAFTETVTSDYTVNLSVSVPNSNNNPYVWAITRANIQSLCIKAAAAMTIYTNAPSTGAPQDTIAMVAGQVFVWTLQTDAIGKLPFSGNVSELYVTNASGGAAQLDVRAICTQ